MNYRQFLNEYVDTVTLPDGKKVSYLDDNVIVFIYSGQYCLFAKADPKTNRVKTIVLKGSNKILEFNFDGNSSYLIHGNIISVISALEDFYAWDINDDNIEIIFDDMDNIIDMKEYITNVGFTDGTGRIFPEGKVIAVRGDIVFPLDIRNELNIVASDFNIKKADDSWLFESSNESTGEINQRYYSDIVKGVNKPKDVTKRKIIDKYKNPAPDLIMDKDWQNAMRILGTNFINNIEIAQKTKSKKEFESFMKRLLPKIRQASLSVGESIISFKQHLKEEWADSIKGKIFRGQVDIFMNPTQEEIQSVCGKGVSYANIVRGFVFVKTGKVVAFDPEALHTDIEYTDIVPYNAYDIDNIVPVFVQIDGKIRPALNDPTDKKFKKVNKILKGLKQKVANQNDFAYI